MNALRKMVVAIGAALVVGTMGAAQGAGQGDDVKWLVEYRADALPASPPWTRCGGDAIRPEVQAGALRLADDSAEEFCCYRAGWEADGACEIVVEAAVRVVSFALPRPRPWLTGSPACILVSNGRRQEGLVIEPDRIGTLQDRAFVMKTTDRFHVYRLAIRGEDLGVFVDGQRKIRGQGAFWKPAEHARPFIQFGSNSKQGRGESLWQYVRLGVRPAPSGQAPAPLRITLSEPWPVVRAALPYPAYFNRPYVYNVGRGLLLMNASQGPEKLYQPFGVFKSTDEGKTWAPIPGLQHKSFAPQAMIRLADGAILGVSRHNVRYDDGVYVGMTCRFDPQAESFTMYENRILVPKDPPGLREDRRILVFDRHIFLGESGTVLAVAYNQARFAYLLRTADEGRTWTTFGTIGRGQEPSVARLSPTEMTALIRQTSLTPFHQVWSFDGGKSWGPPSVLEEGSVDADLVLMSDGVLACSYGRPGCNLMFSLDRGRTWQVHRVVTDASGYNYTAIVEVRPGRLLYVHDAPPPLQALHVDVTRN